MAWVAELGGTDISTLCRRMVWNPKLDRTGRLDVEVPSDLCPALTEGVTELVLSESSVEKHVGPTWYGEDSGGPDDAFTTLTSYDPSVKFNRRYVQDADGDISNPMIFEMFEDAVSIFEAALANTIANDGGFDLAVGTVGSAGVPLVGYRPVDWPLTIEQLRSLLVDTGQLDFQVNPVSGGASTIDITNGDLGTDLSGSVIFDYRTGTFNCTAARYTFDMAEVVTRLRYLLGPKRPQYDGDVQHWAADVQKDDPALDVPPFDTLQPTIDALIAAGDAAYGQLRQILIYDSNGDEDSLKDLWMHLWQQDILSRATPKRLLYMTPAGGIVPSFLPGDIVQTNAVLRTTTSEAQRVHEMEVVVDKEGNGTITQLVTTADPA